MTFPLQMTYVLQMTSVLMQYCTGSCELEIF